MSSFTNPFTTLSSSSSQKSVPLIGLRLAMKARSVALLSVAVVAGLLLGGRGVEVLASLSGALTVEQSGGLLMLVLAAVLVVVRLESTAGLKSSAESLLTWLQEGGEEEDG